MPKVSVIIPVYNTEKYIGECLESIINQTMKDIEIICINDGSPDNSLKILREFEQKDKRIKVIDKKNEGVSVARNKGLEIATGEFVCFIDSDDYYPSRDILETLYNNAKEHNVLICGGEMSEFKNGTSELLQNFCDSCYGYTFEKDGILEYKDYQFDYGFTRFIYSRQMLLENNITFPNITSFEDPVFFTKAMAAAGRFYAMHRIVYAYRQSHKIITATVKIINDSLKGILTNVKLAKKNNFSKLEELSIMRLNKRYDWNKECFLSLINLVPLLKIFLLSYRILVPRIIKHLIVGIFSVKNQTHDNKKYKVITILGIKIKIKVFSTKNSSYLLKHKVIPNTILIIEANNCHGETIPGFVKYFNHLGYAVEILTTPEVIAENPFVSLNKKLYKHLFQLNPIEIKTFLSNDKVKEYTAIFLNSNYLYCVNDSDDIEFFDYCKDVKLPKNGYFALEHHLNFPCKSPLLQNRKLQLANFETGAVFCNSHYFGEIQHKSKNKITNFISVGGMASFRRNPKLLTNAIEKLIQNNITNFKVTVIGFKNNLEIPEHISPYIDFKGRVPYKTVFEEIKKADFFLTLLDPQNIEHDRYVKDGTSGSFQLIYGFNIPGLIEQKFAPIHFFNNDNTIIYNGNENFYNAIIRCIHMNNDEYQKIKNNLKQTAQNIEEISKTNLKNFMESL